MVDIEYNNPNVRTLAIGIDGQHPPRDVLMSLQSTINTQVNEFLEYEQARQTVKVTTEENIYDGTYEMFDDPFIYVLLVDIIFKDGVGTKLDTLRHGTESLLNKNGFNTTTPVWVSNID